MTARIASRAGVAALLLLTGSPHAQPVDHGARPAAAPSTQFTISGAVAHPRSLTLADLEKEPATNQTVFFSTGRGQVTATFKGVLLWTLLGAAEIQADPTVKNAQLRRSVIVSADDGYGVVLSVGELDPAYGAAQALIAYAQDGKPLGPSGFARLVLPADKDGGRNVMRVTNIEVR